MFKKKDTSNSMLHDELAATWTATALITCVVGATFCNRESVSPSTRRIVETLFLIIALVILIWAFASHFNLISYTVHRVGLVFILLAIMAGFVYLVVITLKKNI